MEEEKYIPTERELKAIRLIAKKQRSGIKDISCAVISKELGMQNQNCSDLLHRLCLLRFIRTDNDFISNRSKNNYSLDAMAFEYESLKKIK